MNVNERTRVGNSPSTSAAFRHGMDQLWWSRVSLIYSTNLVVSRKHRSSKTICSKTSANPLCLIADAAMPANAQANTTTAKRLKSFVRKRSMDRSSYLPCCSIRNHRQWQYGHFERESRMVADDLVGIMVGRRACAALQSYSCHRN